MEKFIKEIVEWKQFELEIDTSIYSKDVILKAAYSFLDKGYFFFKYTWENILLVFTKKDDINDDSKKIIMDFSDELLNVYLREILEKENKDIREKIVWAAIANSLDSNNYVEFNTDCNINQEQNQIDFDKDIDEILREIENDPDLKIDEAEIERILKEIEEENFLEDEQPKITLNVNAIKNVKESFQNR